MATKKPKAAPKKPSASQSKPLTSQQKRFCELQVILGLLPSQAWRKVVGPDVPPQIVWNQSSLNMQKPQVQAYIKALEDERKARAEMDAERITQEIWSIALADPNDLIQHRRGACRYCYGKDFRYQWKLRELREALAAHEERQANTERKLRPIDQGGGTGYDHTKDPNPDCPDCMGEGVGYVFVADTRDISPDARRLMAGVKKTKDGIEIKTNSQDRAWEMLGRIKGAFNDKIELTEPLTDEQRMERLAALADAARNRGAGPAASSEPDKP